MSTNQNRKIANHYGNGIQCVNFGGDTFLKPESAKVFSSTVEIKGDGDYTVNGKTFNSSKAKITTTITFDEGNEVHTDEANVSITFNGSRIESIKSNSGAVTVYFSGENDKGSTVSKIDTMSGAVTIDGCSNISNVTTMSGDIDAQLSSVGRASTMSGVIVTTGSKKKKNKLR
jgi:hypothetical protein